MKSSPTAGGPHMDEANLLQHQFLFFFSYTVTFLFHQQNFLNHWLNVFKDIGFIERLCALKFFPVRGFPPLTFMEGQRTFWFHFDRKTEMARSGFTTCPVGKACLSLTWAGIYKSPESQPSPWLSQAKLFWVLPYSSGRGFLLQCLVPGCQLDSAFPLLQVPSDPQPLGTCCF